MAVGRGVGVLLIASLCVIVSSCGGSEAAAPRSTDADEAAIRQVTANLASAVSRLDAEGAARDMPLDSSVVYVSDGTVIRGVDYIPTLESFYDRLDSLEFDWMDEEITFPSPETAVVVGWASIRAKVGDGPWLDDPAIFTTVLRSNGRGQWVIVTSHKTSTGR